MKNRENNLIIGASGLCGQLLFRQLKDARLLLRSSYKEYCKDQVILEDFKEIGKDNIAERIFVGIETLFYCYGTTLKKAGSKERFFEIENEIPFILFRQAKKFGVKKIVMISSVGANSKSRNYYLRTKGILENFVLAQSFESLIILRPSLLLGSRNEKRLMERISQFILSPFCGASFLKQYAPVQAKDVASTMAKLGIEKREGFHIVNYFH